MPWSPAAKPSPFLLRGCYPIAILEPLRRTLSLLLYHQCGSVPRCLAGTLREEEGEGSGCRDAYHFAQETCSWKLSLLATGSRVGDVGALVQLVQMKRRSPPPSTCTLVNDRHLGPPGSLRLTPLKPTSVCNQKTTAVVRVELTTERRKKQPCRWTRFSINHDPHRRRGQAY